MGSNPLSLTGTTQCQLFTLLSNIMFTVNYRSSSAVSSIEANPISGHVVVTYKNGARYSYERVNRFAIANLLLNNNISLGFWVNDVLLPYYSTAVCTAV